MSFKDYHFKQYVQQALEEIGFVNPTEVQKRLIPIVNSGRDLVGESKTGSGKTHTFLLPIFEKLDEAKAEVQVVITAPSRELATQIFDACKQIAKHSQEEIRLANYVGGTDKLRQIEKLKGSQPHIVIGTPGRIYDLVKSGDLAIHKATTFVVDEADMTMDMGFLDTVDKIAASFPKSVQILVFSATIPQKLQPFLKKYLTNPVIEQIKTKTVIADTIDNWLVSTKGRDKNGQLLEILKTMQPYMAMLFVNTKERADDLHAFLTANGLKVAKIHGGISPRERKRIMNQVKKLDFEYIVATDLAARGIDIEGVSHVINDAI
ncbi:TPA: DEAD/DEAH box helicase, partial [Streptococcus pyogenes MGAS15005]|nr:DEAD/DEAH box helicase [Streptococcus pyogenes MGAS15009]HER5205627.1 DEAD/DEAH box helicase [Streptococcus pyogenes MGAS15005]